MTERELWLKCVDYCIKNEIVGFHLMFDEFIKMRNAQGFKLAPKKCTNNMAHAAKSVDARLSVFKYSDVWDAMLSVVEVQE